MIDFKQLNDPVFLQGDRMPVYRQLREEQPALELLDQERQPFWLVSRHADVQALLRQPEARVQPPGMDTPAWLAPGPAMDRMKANLAQTDAPVHTRLRKLLSPLFMPRRVESLRAIAAESVQRALQAVPSDGQPFDVVQQMASQVPQGVTCHLLGIPAQDWSALVSKQHDFLLIFSSFRISDEEQRRLDAVVAFYMAYFQSLLGSGSPRSEFVELLLEAESRNELSRKELLSIMHTVLDAGYETTRTSIANAIEVLAVNPALYARLRAEPERVPNAVEELLRYRTPIHVRNRFLATDYTTSNGVQIPAGANVLLMLASANRDAAVFEAPDEMDPGRRNANAHQAFGGGMHHCLGGPIARIQLQETLRGILEHVETIAPGDKAGERYPSLKFPALAKLDVRFQFAGRGRETT
ncbi:Vitamin D(3) 25-hydroxylase [Variovorax sp. PBS-H4]|uniref:cytochrome P450 n=1 Tax=Variovorax sp. PBS-H4 TaxID=434008 RepID=UPI001316F7E9|nr:cytochrome P450 [Variovorax sp. PBS-H4]VTU22903.1 Vitamin D(3) 25-hydroxylase [Variovorax sp. PBS-H4]